MSCLFVDCVCVPGLCRWALVQTVQSHQAPDREGPRGRQCEESQVHPQRHRPVGRRRGVLCPGETDSFPNPYGLSEVHASLWNDMFSSTHGTQDTRCSCHGNHQTPPRRLPAFVWHPFSVSMFLAPKRHKQRIPILRWNGRLRWKCYKSLQVQRTSHLLDPCAYTCSVSIWAACTQKSPPLTIMFQ